MRNRRLISPRKDFLKYCYKTLFFLNSNLGKCIERLWSSLKIVDIKHCGWMRQVRKSLLQRCINSLCWTKVGDSTIGWYTGSRNDQYVFWFSKKIEIIYEVMKKDSLEQLDRMWKIVVLRYSVTEPSLANKLNQKT